MRAALAGGHLELAGLLIEQAAGAGEASKELLRASAEGTTIVARFLMACPGVNPNTYRQRRGSSGSSGSTGSSDISDVNSTAIVRAAEGGHVEIVRHLASLASVDLHRTAARSLTALAIAEESKVRVMVRVRVRRAL